MNSVRVLIIDDSSVVQMLLKQGLEKDSRLEVVGVAADPYEAREKIAECRPDVLTLDIRMPRMNGLTFLQKLMHQFPLPVIMVSSHTTEGARLTMDCLRAGAIDFVAKPARGATELESILEVLRSKVWVASGVDVRTQAAFRHEMESVAGMNWTTSEQSKRALIALGASTGGTEALSFLLAGLSRPMPPILIVQHMPAGYTHQFAARLNELTDLKVIEARDGMQVESGSVYVAAGGMQMKVRELRIQRRLELRVGSRDKVSGHCPSVDVMFESLTTLKPRPIVAALLTGMGQDGAQGLLHLRQCGARTLSQDEASSVVYGMPKAAVNMGAVQREVSLKDLPKALVDELNVVSRQG